MKLHFAVKWLLLSFLSPPFVQKWTKLKKTQFLANMSLEIIDRPRKVTILVSKEVFSKCPWYHFKVCIKIVLFRETVGRWKSDYFSISTQKILDLLQGILLRHLSIACGKKVTFFVKPNIKGGILIVICPPYAYCALFPCLFLYTFLSSFIRKSSLYVIN